MPLMNKVVLMSGADYFNDQQAINALMDSSLAVDVAAAKAEHRRIQEALEAAGVRVVKVPAPPDSQDGVYTANWALVRHGKALMSRLPVPRQPEESYALSALRQQGLETLVLPDEVERFSGQGDALACGNIVFTQSPYRTTTAAHPYLKDWLGFEQVIALETKPARWFGWGPPKRNKVTGLPDSPTYDIDLALAVLKWPYNGQKGLIAWCPDVFKHRSQRLLRLLETVDKIEVSRDEALDAYALNLVSTGQTVIMNSGALRFETALRTQGLQTVTLDLPELRKGGGSIRCSTLTLEY
jgi:N-dimethylarginine dimethylaminohydrolase